MFDPSQFSSQCSYCLKGINEKLTVCFCGNSLCDTHFDFHKKKFNCNALFSVESSLESVKIIPGENIDFSEIQSLENEISKIIKQETAKGPFDLPSCPHFNYDVSYSKDTNIRCDNCELNERIWVCLKCGHKGCGRIQPFNTGNGHAMLHYNLTLHPHVQLENDIHCYTCDLYVKNPKKPSDSTSNFTGIRNKKQNCYVNSVLHLLKKLITTDLVSHFDICTKNPINCFLCQFIKIHSQLDTFGKTVNITDFLERIYDSGQFKINKHEDAGEFLEFVMEKLSAAESNKLIEPISGNYTWKIRSTLSCTCGYSEKTESNSSLILLPMDNDDLNAAFNHNFNNSKIQCRCGNLMDDSVEFLEIQKYLLIGFVRTVIVDGQIVKLCNKIKINNIEVKGNIYKLKSCIIHMGNGATTGHYVYWDATDSSYLVDDDMVFDSNIQEAEDGVIFLLERIED